MGCKKIKHKPNYKTQQRDRPTKLKAIVVAMLQKRFPEWDGVIAKNVKAAQVAS